MKRTKESRPPTVTVGIPAYNEEHNIGNLLASISRQDAHNFKLQEILVCCDGSTDRTVDIVKGFAKKNKLVKVMEGKRRHGKAYRLNQLFERSTGDILILFDADVIPTDDFTLSELVRPFDHENVGLVGGDIKPLPSHTLIGNITAASRELWSETTRGINGGATVHNHHGQVSAMRRNVFKKIRMPLIHSEDDYRYFRTKQLGYLFKFAPRAVVLYRTPETLRDFFLQSARFASGRAPIVSKFGSWVVQEYAVPVRNKMHAIVTMLRRKPLVTAASLTFHFLSRIAARRIRGGTVEKGMWNIARSTKRVLHDDLSLHIEST